jgi:hypothetical protein
MSQVMKTAKAATLRERCPILTQVPVGLLAAITALIVAAAIVAAIGMAVHGFHPVNLASSMAWTNT